MKYQSLANYKYRLYADETFVTFPVSEHLIAETEFISLDGSTLAIRAGYCWDGASGPAMDTRSTMRASLAHDALYQLMRKGVLPVHYRGASDRFYRELCLSSGMSRLRAWYHFKGVSWFGSSNAKIQPSRKPPVIDV